MNILFLKLSPMAMGMAMVVPMLGSPGPGQAAVIHVEEAFIVEKCFVNM